MHTAICFLLRWFVYEVHLNAPRSPGWCPHSYNFMSNMSVCLIMSLLNIEHIGSAVKVTSSGSTTSTGLLCTCVSRPCGQVCDLCSAWWLVPSCTASPGCRRRCPPPAPPRHGASQLSPWCRLSGRRLGRKSGMDTSSLCSIKSFLSTLYFVL